MDPNSPSTLLVTVFSGDYPWSTVAVYQIKAVNGDMQSVELASTDVTPTGIGALNLNKQVTLLIHFK